MPRITKVKATAEPKQTILPAILPRIVEFFDSKTGSLSAYETALKG